MKREWYNYGPAARGVSALTLRARLPASLQGRLLKDPILEHGVCASADDAQLRDELDRFFGVGKAMKIMRRLCAEVDRNSLSEYDYYCIGGKDIDYRFHNNAEAERPRTPAEFVNCIKYKWPSPGLRMREVLTRLDPFDRIILLSPEAKSLFENSGVRGVQYTVMPDGLWLMRVVRRVPCHAADINPIDYEAASQSVGGPYLFGLRYEQADFGAEDLQLIDRIEVGAKTYRYRRPWLVASRRFVEICMEKRVNGVRSPNILFDRGMVPILVGRGPITSMLAANRPGAR